MTTVARTTAIATVVMGQDKGHGNSDSNGDVWYGSEMVDIAVVL